MANNPYVNKVVFGSATLVDLTGTTATADKIMQGYGAFGADGAWMDGTASGGDQHGTIWQDGQGYVHLDDESGIALQSKSVTPSESQQIVEAGEGYYALDKVTVGAISSSYVGSGVSRRSSSDLTANGATVTAPAGYYSSSASKTVASGTAGTPTATKSEVFSNRIFVTPSVTNTTGYITGGTETGNPVVVSASELVSGTFNVSSSGVYNVTDYASINVQAGTEGTPIATKSSVYNHAISVTPQVTNSEGCITGGTKTGTAVTVSASELVSGTKSITQNGTGIDVTNYASVNVSVGGSTANIDDPVRFFDYDGTLLHSYSASDFQALTAMPANPSHSGLTAQGWNWTLANAKTQLTAMGACDIGQMYVTDDGKTRVYVHFENERCSPYLGIGVNGTVTVDWGDNTATTTLTGTSLSTAYSAQHSYATGGDYVITLTATNGTFAIIGNTNSTHIIKYSSSVYASSVGYANCVKKIELGSNVTLGDDAFIYCRALESITIPSTVTSIGASAFNYCSSLKAVILPSTLTTIGNRLCYGDDTIEVVSLPNGLTAAPDYLIDAAYAMKRIVLPYNTTSIGSYAFAYCRTLSEFVMPSGVTSIGNYAFNATPCLRNVTLPNGITAIGDNVFNGCCSLVSITIPSNVITIGSGAFNSCYNLAEIHFTPTTPPTVSAASAWTSVPADCKIYVPSGTLSEYTSASNYPSTTRYTYIEE